MISRHHHEAPVTFGFFVAQNAGCLSVALISETLHAANRLSGQRLIDIRMFSHDGQPVQTTSRMTYPIAGRVDEAGALDNVVLASSYDIPAAHKKRLIAAVRQHFHRGACIWAVESATLLLAEANMVRGHRLAVHWEFLPYIQEKWPDLDVCKDLYQPEGRIVTSGGMTASLDMTLHYLASQFGQKLARDVAEEFAYPSPRPPDSPQQLKELSGDWNKPSTLVKALAAMEENIETPLTIEDVARMVGISTRHLENQMQRHLRETPQQRYRLIRLRRGRELLLHSQLSITEVALATGFASVSTFSHSFRQSLGVSPRTYRERFLNAFESPYIRV